MLSKFIPFRSNKMTKFFKRVLFRTKDNDTFLILSLLQIFQVFDSLIHFRNDFIYWFELIDSIALVKAIWVLALNWNIPCLFQNFIQIHWIHHFINFFSSGGSFERVIENFLYCPSMIVIISFLVGSTNSCGNIIVLS